MSIFQGHPYTTYLSGYTYKVFSKINYSLEYYGYWNWPFLDVFLLKRVHKV